MAFTRLVGTYTRRVLLTLYDILQARACKLLGMHPGVKIHNVKLSRITTSKKHALPCISIYHAILSLSQILTSVRGTTPGAQITQGGFAGTVYGAGPNVKIIIETSCTNYTSRMFGNEHLCFNTVFLPRDTVFQHLQSMSRLSQRTQLSLYSSGDLFAWKHVEHVG